MLQRQGAQISRREAYFNVRRNDEGCGATQYMGIFRCQPTINASSGQVSTASSSLRMSAASIGAPGRMLLA